jgi:hypothetical protein
MRNFKMFTLVTIMKTRGIRWTGFAPCFGGNTKLWSINLRGKEYLKT